MRDLDLGLDLGIKHSGYRLSHFQLYNWGNFDNHIVNINTDGENTLLTGANGTGKTTIVDALLTLIVPTNDRTYNLSSGHDGKNGRTEESYVLGAYSTEKNNDDYTATRKLLRDKSCHSIILANFSNNTAENSITLMQIRYFSANGSLKRQYFVIEGFLSIDMLNENNIGYNPNSNWIQILKKTFPDILITSFDTFKRYSQEFSKKFGFRYKDKAIKIFSQTVGMKDLYDLNSFIRDRMLDEGSSFESFNTISKNYYNLMQLKTQIEKEELQINLLEKIKESHSSFTFYSTKKEKKELIKDKYLKTWEAQTSLSILKNEIETYSKNLVEQEEIVLENNEQKKLIEENINEIKQTLFSDERTERINGLEVRRKDLINTINHIQKQVDVYSKNLNILNLDFPKTIQEFSEIKNSAISKLEIFENKISKLEDDKNELTLLENSVKKQISNISNQLIAIKNKNSNIPLNYLEIRDKISKDTLIDSEELKFMGELIRVNDNSLDKALAIESLIRPIALSLMVYPQNAIKVAKYLNENELKNLIQIIIIENISENNILNGEDKDQLNIFDDNEEIIFDEENIPILSNMMLEIKEDCTYKSFILKYLESHFKYTFNESLENVISSNNTFSEQGLLNTNNKFIKPITNEEFDIHILGWETEKKITRLEIKKRELEKQLIIFVEDIKTQISNINKAKNKLNSCIYLSEFNDYSAIDITKYRKQIDNIDDQLLELKNNSSDLEELRNSLILNERKKIEVEKTIANLYQAIGGIKSTLLLKQKEKEQIDNYLFNQDLTSFFEPISKMQIEYELPKTFSDTKEVKHYKEITENKINNEINTFEEQAHKAEKELSSRISQFINPKPSILEDYPSWSNDTINLSSDLESIELFELMLDKLKTDSLPKYKEKFSNLRTRQIQQDIIDLNSNLKEWNRKIKDNIFELNESLNSITYQKNPETRIRITIESSRDKEIRKFKNLLEKAIPDPGIVLLGEEDKKRATEIFLTAVDDLVTTLKDNDRFANKVLDVRNWYQFAVEEYYTETSEQARFYKDSAAISGGQKAKLAYTILAAAIAHQFDVFNYENTAKSFRFVIVDEAFSKSDDNNSRYAMDLFKAMDLQLMVVTPMDKVNLVEPYIDSVQITVCEDGKHSFVHSIKKEELENVNTNRNT